MFKVPVGLCFNFHKKSVTANSVCISLFGDFELQVSACYGHHQAAQKYMNVKNSTFQRGEGFPLHSGLKYTICIYNII
jgi:hypothetical protein